MDAAVRAMAGFRSIMDGYGVVACRAVATSAVREAANADIFLDRVRVRTGITIDVIDGSEESRFTYLATRERLRNHPAAEAEHALLLEVGGGSADLTRLERMQPTQSGVYPLGAIRLRQMLASWHGPHEQRIRLLTRAHRQRRLRRRAGASAWRGDGRDRAWQRHPLRRRQARRAGRRLPHGAARFSSCPS